MGRSEIEALAAKLRAEPSSVDARIALAEALVDDDKIEEAIELYRRSAKMLAARGEFAAALAACKAILALDPAHRAALAQLQMLLTESTSVGRKKIVPIRSEELVATIEMPKPTFPEDLQKHSRGPRLLDIAQTLSHGEEITDVPDGDRFRDETLSGAGQQHAAGTRAETPKGKDRASSKPNRWDPVRESEIVRLPPDPHEVAQFKLFAELPQDALAELLCQAERRRVVVGTKVVRQGEHDDAFYLVLSGQLRVVRDGNTMATLQRGDFFGEVAMLADHRRHATVSAMTEVELLCFAAHTLEALMRAHRGVARTIRHFYDQRLLTTLIMSAPIFFTMSDMERAQAADQFRLLHAAPRDRILSAGQPGSGLFLVLVGTVAVHNGQKIIATLEEGCYFGEMSILLGRDVSADVTAVTPCDLAFLPAPQFTALLKRHPTVWQDMQNEAIRRDFYNHALLVGAVEER